jgi:hypothetical protein
MKEQEIDYKERDKKAARFIAYVCIGMGVLFILLLVASVLGPPPAPARYGEINFRKKMHEELRELGRRIGR